MLVKPLLHSKSHLRPFLPFCTVYSDLFILLLRRTSEITGSSQIWVKITFEPLLVKLNLQSCYFLLIDSTLIN